MLRQSDQGRRDGVYRGRYRAPANTRGRSCFLEKTKQLGRGPESIAHRSVLVHPRLQMKLSRDGSSIAYTVDPGDGSERLQVHVQRIGSAGLGTRLPQLEGSVSIEWSHDGSHLYYTRADALGRPSR